MNCSQVVAHFTDYLDGTASAEDAAAIERHLDGCTKCVRYENVLRNGSALLRTLPALALREAGVKDQGRVINRLSKT